MNTRLIELRKGRCLSQETLSQELGISQQVLSKIERDESKMTREHLEILSDYFNVSVDYLLGRTSHRRTLEGESIIVENVQRNYETLQLYERLGSYQRKLLHLIVKTMVELENQ